MKKYLRAFTDWQAKANAYMAFRDAERARCQAAGIKAESHDAGTQIL